MALEIVRKTAEISKFAQKLRTELFKNAERITGKRVGFPGDSGKDTIYYKKDGGFWFVYRRLRDRQWIGFGLEYPSAPMVTILAELNYPHAGSTRTVGAAFGLDQQGRAHFLSRGKLAGGAIGVGKHAFWKKAKGLKKVTLCDPSRPQSQLEEVVFDLGPVGRGRIIANIAKYLEQVQRFKYKIVRKRRLTSIQSAALNDSPAAAAGQLAGSENIAAKEGGQRLVRHLRRERNPKLRRLALARLRKKGRVVCAACNFSFDRKYGPSIGLGLGVVFHHIRPISEGARRTRIEDLVALCPNCHWAVHTRKPDPLTVRMIRRAIQNRSASKA